MNKNTFVYNVEWYVILADFPKEVRTDVYEAINIYAMSGVIVELEPVAKMAFAFIRREMDYNNEKYAATVEKRRAAGKRSAASRAQKALAVKSEVLVEEPRPETTAALGVTPEVLREEPREETTEALAVTPEVLREESDASGIWDEVLDNDNTLKTSEQGNNLTPNALDLKPHQEPEPAKVPDIIPTAELNARLAKEFEKFRQAYPGTKRSADVEFEYFKNRHPRRWQTIVPRLMPAVERLIAYHTAAEEARKTDPKIFVPNYPYLSTWINGARWDDEYPKIRTSAAPTPAALRPAPAEAPKDFGGRIY